MSIVEETPTTRKTLRGGVEPYKLSDEERAQGRAIALQKRRDAKEAYRTEQLIPKSWRVQNRHLTSRKTPAAVAQRAAEFVWEQEHGKATQRVEQVDSRQATPWEGLTPEAKVVRLRELQALYEARLKEEGEGISP